MKKETLNHLDAINQTIALEDWKAALDALILTMRKEFVFDNLVVYLTDKQKDNPEVAYARAVGRGRKAEADADWGETIANQVISTGKILQDSATIQASEDRVAMPYLLGLPLLMYRAGTAHRGAGALIFIRFGGPEYTTAQIQMAALAASQVSRILEWRLLRENIAQLEQARHRAQLQDDFISTVSHDLYTPLGFIKGYATSLLRSDTTWDAETQREFLTTIDEETDHVMTLVDKFLDSARLYSGMMNMDFQPVRLDSLIRDVVLRLKGRNKSLHVDLDLEISPPIQADTVRLAQVFENLFENALKYAPDSNISITLRNLGDRLTVTFADRGPGIAAEHLPFLFERFYRVAAQSGKRGTGLGLFICRQIVQAHNGQISVETAPGKGTAFRIDLPVRQHPMADK